MKIYTSYFYQIRFMKKNMLPISTAVWDPSWFHGFMKNPDFLFVDKRGIINGLRCPAFAPGDTCNTLCRGINRCETQDSSKCEFLKAYRKQLDDLKFDKVMKFLEKCADKLDTEDPIVVLMFHEAPCNPCSERIVVQQWFKDHGIKVTELKYPIKDNY